MQNTQWRSRTSCRKFRWLDNSRSHGPKRQSRVSKQSSICSRGARLSHSMDPGVSVQNTNFSGNEKELAKVLGAKWEASSQLHWQFLGIWQSLWRSLLEALYVNTIQIRNKNGIAERAVRRVKEGTSAVLLQSCLGNEWWADSMECNCYLRNVQDILSDGETPYERRFGMPFHAQLSRLEQWSNSTRFLQKALRDYINLVLKSCKVYSSVMLCMRRESGKETLWSQTLKNWRRWTHQNSTPESSMQRKC